MGSENNLQHELAELKLLVKGLSKIPDFPSELLDLISGKVESICQWTLPAESIHPDGFCDCTSMEKDAVDEFFKTVSEETTCSAMDVPDSGSSFEQVVQSVERSLKEPTVQKPLVDLMKRITLNDRFRFQREFFDNDSQKMNRVFSTISQLNSVEEALDYFLDVCPVDKDTDSYSDFCAMLESHFTGFSNSRQF